MSFAWYDVPLQDMDGRVKLIRASGMLRTARSRVGVLRLDRQQRQPGLQARELPGLARQAKRRLPCEGHGRPW